MFTGGVNAWSAQLPSAIAALACLFLIARWASDRNWRSPSAIPVVIILATCIQFIRQAHNAQIDMLLCLLVLSASLLGYKQLRGQRNSQLGIGLLMGLAILTKGPVGYLIPAETWLFYCLLNGRDSWKHYPYKALLWGLLPPLIWIGGLTLQVWQQGSWDYWNNLLFKQTVVRYTNLWGHHQPFYYFFLTQLTSFFPWCLFLPLAFPWSKKQRSSQSKKQRFAWSAYLFILLFFSLITGKRSLYILPLYPFAAYLVADYLVRLPKLRRTERAVNAIAGIVFVAIGCGIIGIVTGTIQLEILESIDTPIPQIPIIIPALLIIAGGSWGIFSAFREKAGQLPFGFAVSIFSLSILLYQIISPWHNERRSSRSFSEQVTAVLETKGEGTALGMVDFRSAYRFYGTQKIEELSTYNPTKNDPKMIGLPKPNDFWIEHPDGLIICRSDLLDEFKVKDSFFRSYTILIDQLISDKRYQLIEAVERPATP